MKFSKKFFVLMAIAVLYFIFPLDLLPDPIYFDDIGVFALAILGSR